MSEESVYRDQIEATFFEARNLPASERSAFLDHACRGNEKLRYAVLDLVDADANAGEFFDTPINLEETSGRRAAECEGTTIGQYELLQELGEGGFGVVFMAEQSAPVRRKVALKIIKPGMDSRAVIARFEAERQALAMMNHPNVASVLDGGTTDSGRPFFVMELIRGVSITEYCKKRRLGTKNRMRLFVDVCKAVQHAHQNGIIHRDLKPSNVMVTLHDGSPVVKVIDFGVAKAVNQHLTNKTLFTRYGQMIGTPQYMSPEQAEMSGLDVDTRSDIYSLGVLLYELLTGSTPLTEQRLRQATFAEMQRIISEEELPKPSVRLSTTSAEEVSDLAEERGISSFDPRKEIPDELDCIVMKTLEKERNRRYRTAIELADDINRYLNDEAVEARPPSVGYRVTKYVRKNRLVVAAAAVVAAILLLSTITSSALAWWAVTEGKQTQEALGAERRALKDLEESKSLLQEQTDALIDKIYEAHFARAIAAYDNGYLGQAKESLAECPATSRGWEWSRQNYLSNSRDFVTIPPSPYGVFTNDSRFLITCGGGDAPNEINTWSVDTGERRHSLSVGVHKLTRIAIHPGGRIVTVGDARGQITAVDVLSDGVLWTTAAHAKGVAGIAYSPDGERIVTVANENILKIWDANSGKLLASHEYDGRLWAVEFDATGTLLLANVVKTSSMRESRAALIVDSQTGDVVRRVDHIGRSANGTAFHPDGKRIATGDDECVIVRRIRDGRVEQVLSGGRGYWGNDNCSPRYSPDGRWIAASSGGVILLWDTSSGMIVKKLAGDHSVAFLGSFSPDGTKVSVLAQREGGSLRSEIRVYDLSGRSGTGGLPLSGTHEGALCVAFSPDSSRVAAAGVERSIRIWDRRTCEETNVLYGHADPIWRMAWNVDGQVLFSHDHGGFLRAWDVENGKCRWVARTLPKPGDLRGYPNVNGLIATPDGKHVLLSWINGETIVYDAQSGKEKTRLSGKGEVNINGVACSTNGEWIATGSDDGSIVIWDGNTFEKCRVLDGHAGSVRAVAFTPDNKSIASGSYDGTVRVWDHESGKEISTLRGHQFGVWSLEFSADGRRLFSADGPGLIIVWDVERRREIYRWRHENFGNRLDVSPDGSTVVTASVFGEVRLWETVLPDADTLKKRRLFELARQAVDKTDQTFASEHAKRIEADQTLVDEVREAALRLVTVRSDDPYVLNRASWETVRDGREEAFQLALEQAKRAWEFAPDCSDYAITTGVAHFRLGQLQECVEVLNQAEANLLPDALLWSDDPRIDLRPYLYATLAMAHHQIGNTELAEKAFDAAKEHRRNRRVVDPDIDAYLRDAEALLHSNLPERQSQ